PSVRTTGHREGRSMSDFPREPGAPTFERLRALAKQLVRDVRAGDTAALERLRRQLPRLSRLDPATAAATVRLADAQHALAREAGVESWAALKALVESQEPLIQQVARFMRALQHADRATMLRALEKFPEIARTSIHAACAACDEAAFEARLAHDP